MSLGVRITYKGKSNHILFNLQRSYAKMLADQMKLSDGKKIHRPSDSPIDVTNALKIRTKKSQIEQFKRNIEDGKAFMMNYDTVLQSTVNSLQRARELAIQGRNDTYDATTRRYLGQEVAQIIRGIVQFANTTYKGNYIFNGTMTDEPPYILRSEQEDMTITASDVGTPLQIGASLEPPTENIIPTSVKVTNSTGSVIYQEGVDYKIDYKNGTITILSGGAIASSTPTDITIFYENINKNPKSSRDHIYRQIGENEIIPINLTTHEVFENTAHGTDIFDSLITLAEGLVENNVNDIETSIDKIDIIQQQVVSASAKNGARINRIENALFDIKKENQYVTDLMSQFEDIDFAEVISDFHLQENLFNASLQVASKILQPFLGDYL